MGWNVLIELLLEHEYYAPNMPPVTVWPSDREAFGSDGFLLRQSGSRVFVLAEDGNDKLPETLALDLEIQNPDVVSVTAGADWQKVPLIVLGAGVDGLALTTDTHKEEVQKPGRLLLAQVIVALQPPEKRAVTVKFSAVTSHWAYYVIGSDTEDVVIEDPEGEVLFDAVGTMDLPDGTPARVIRSRAALPARARPGQRFSLSRPAPFGPRTLIPVLPTPKPQFAEVPGPDGAGAITQSDIYVSIF